MIFPRTIRIIFRIHEDDCYHLTYLIFHRTEEGYDPPLFSFAYVLPRVTLRDMGLPASAGQFPFRSSRSVRRVQPDLDAWVRRQCQSGRYWINPHSSISRVGDKLAVLIQGKSPVLQRRSRRPRQDTYVCGWLPIPAPCLTACVSAQCSNNSHGSRHG